jgi:hypothetical protein
VWIINSTDNDLAGNFLLLILYWGYATNLRGILIECLHLLVQGYQGSVLFSRVFIGEEADGVGDKGWSGNATPVDVQIQI